ncbi:MAG: choice-of-anchor tandem repeat GloVer-containing protein [Candidatus Cybelea sp.]
MTLVAVLAGCGADISPSLPAAGLQAAGPAKVHATEKVLYSFADGVDGGGPNGGLVFDASGNAYGTTHFGGNDSCGGQVGGGCGVVFELSSKGSGSWSETPLYAFQDAGDGGFPNAGVILDKSGDVLGTASTGGNFTCSIGCGVVYELSKSSGWTESVLHTFEGSDGEFPNATLLPSANGTLYSTTWYGGSSGNGTVFSLAPGGSGGRKESVLYSFRGTTDGSAPAGGVVADRSGNLYGTTYKYDGDNDGVAFELHKHAAWKDSVSYTFTNNGGGEDPYAGMIMPAKGTLYGTAIESGPNDGGVAFELALGTKHQWTEKVLHAFGAPGDGNSPYGAVIADKGGNLYGTTVFGGASNAGIVYELSPSKNGQWKEKILYSFTGGSDGRYPSGSLTLDASGNLYGATSNGGQNGYGALFEITR